MSNYINNFEKKYEQESIQIECEPPASVAPIKYQYWRDRSSSEQACTGLWWWPPDVTTRGWVCPGGTPNMWPISWCMWCYLSPPPVDRMSDRQTSAGWLNKNDNIYIFIRQCLAGFTTYLNYVHDIEMPPDQFTYCAIANTMLFMSSTCSVLLILKMTFERFYSIIKPHKAASFNTVKRAKIAIIIIVVSGVSFNVPHIFMSTHEGRECVPWARGMDRFIAQLHFYASFSINFAFPFVSLLTMNSFIIHTLRTRSMVNVTKSEGQGRNEGQISKLKALISKFSSCCCSLHLHFWY